MKPTRIQSVKVKRRRGDDSDVELPHCSDIAGSMFTMQLQSGHVIDTKTRLGPGSLKMHLRHVVQPATLLLARCSAVEIRSHTVLAHSYGRGTDAHLDSRYLYAVTGASRVFYEHSETSSNRLTPVVGEKSPLLQCRRCQLLFLHTSA